MKQNLEISLKFWIIFIIAFAIVLSIPFCDYLFNNHLLRHIYVTGLIICSLLFLAIAIDLLLRNSELKSKLNKETFFKDVSMQTIEGYETQIKEQEDHIKELKKSFENAVVEITDLRVKSKIYTESMLNMATKIEKQNSTITYWKERALHQKHTKKEVEREWYEYIGESSRLFKKGNKYKSTKKHENKDLIFVIAEDGKEYLDSKIYFKPATNGN